jgi:hypothetical protein
MEIVQTQENPALPKGTGGLIEDAVAYGGGVVVAVAGLEIATTELEDRGLIATKPVAVVAEYLASLGLIYYGRKMDGFARKFVIGGGAGAFAAATSNVIELLRGA